MDEAKELTIEWWLYDSKTLLDYFYLYWCNSRASHPSDYPDRMTPEEWAEQFESWMIKEKEKATP